MGMARSGARHDVRRISPVTIAAVAAVALLFLVAALSGCPRPAQSVDKPPRKAPVSDLGSEGHPLIPEGFTSRDSEEDDEAEQLPVDAGVQPLAISPSLTDAAPESRRALCERAVAHVMALLAADSDRALLDSLGLKGGDEQLRAEGMRMCLSDETTVEQIRCALAARKLAEVFACDKG